MGILTASVRELTNARALDVALTDAAGNQLTTLDVNVLSAPGFPAPTTATLTSVASSAISVPLLAANASRKKFRIHNDSTRTLKVAFGVDASNTVFSVLIPAQGEYESQLNDFTGAINGIWSSANGFARITSITA